MEDVEDGFPVQLQLCVFPEGWWDLNVFLHLLV